MDSTRAASESSINYDIMMTSLCRDKVEKEERKVLAAAGCNVGERVFSPEEVSLSLRLHLLYLSLSLSFSLSLSLSL